MSQSIILITDKSVSLDEIKSKFAPHFRTGFSSPDRLVAESEGEYLAFDADDNIVDDYDEGELEYIPISSPKFYSVKFTDFVFFKKLLPFMGMPPSLRYNSRVAA